MMRGDSNDGFARFIVDGLPVGEFDMFNLGNQTLIVSGLDLSVHSIEVVQLGIKNSSSADDHVAIYGGGALAPVPIPGTLWLLGSGLAGLAGTKIRRKTQ